MKVLVVFPYNCHDSGGVRNAAMGLVRTLRWLDLTVSIATPSERPAAKDEDLCDLVDTIHYYPGLPANRKGVFLGDGVDVSIPVGEVDIVIVWWLTGFCKTFADEALRQKKPYYFYSGGIFSDFGLIHRIAKLFYFTFVNSFVKKCAGVVLPTSREVKQFAVLNPFCRNKAVWIPHEIPRLDFVPERVKGDVFTFGFMGRLHVPVKGLDLLLRAYARAKCRGQSRIVLAGPDWEGGRACLEGIMKDEGLTSKEVEFLGGVYNEAKSSFLSSIDCYVQLSRYEGFGIALVEAMQYGTPVLVSKYANITNDLLAAKACMATDLEIEHIAAKLDEIFEIGDQQLNIIGARGKKWVEEYCSIESVAEKTKKVLLKGID